MALRIALFGGAAATGAFFNSFRQSTSNTAQAYGSENKLLVSLRGNPDKVFDHHFRPFRLGEVINLAQDVAVFRFLLPNVDDEFALNPCSTLQVSHRTGANMVEQVVRCYTPISPNGTRGYFDVLVKKQPNGRMTETMFALEVGESLFFRVQEYKLSYLPNKWKHVGMIGGGTGITPLFQVINHALSNDDDDTKLSLLFANRRESNILLRGTLDDLAEKFADRFKVHYIVNQADASWKGYTGHINAQTIKETMPAPGRDIKVLICGPDKMMAHLCGAAFGVMKAMSGSTPMQPAGGHLQNFSDLQGVLGGMGYDKEMLYRF